MSSEVSFALVDEGATRQIDIDELIRHLNGAAYACAALANTRMIYAKFREPSGQRGARGAIDGALSWIINPILEGVTASPGIAGIEQDDVRIERDRASFAQKWLSEALDTAGEGGFEKLNAYMKKRAAQKARDVEAIRQVFRQANAANTEIDHALSVAILRTSQVKLVCTVVIAVSPLAAGAGLFGAASATAEVLAQAGVISFVYTLGKNAGKTVAQGNNPLPGLAKDAGKKVAKDAAKSSAKAIGAAATMSASNSIVLRRQAERKIASLTRRLADTISSSKQQQMVRRIAGANQQAAQASRAAATAKVVGISTKSVPVIFAAMSVWDAISEYKTDVSGQ